MNSISRIKIFTLLAALPLAAVAQQPNKPAPLPLDPTVRTGKLSNGFTYYIRHNEEPKNRVIMYLANKAGSILEDEHQRGLAHFMEHMSFNGTKHFPKNELINYLQKSGIRFGADLNAYTGFDETVYQLPIPADKPELLKGAFSIMRDWAQEATLDPAEINKERGVVLEEKRLGKGAAERMQRIYWPVMLNNSRYAERLPIGKDTVLNNFKPEAIKSFYHDWYRPDLQALIVVGDINVGEIENTIKKTFSSLKNPVHEKARTKYAVSLTGKNQFIKVTDKEMTATAVDVLIKHQAPKLKTEADYRIAVEQELFNQMLGGRFSELSRKADVPFISGGANISALMGGLDSYDASVEAKPGQLEAGTKAVWRETVRLIKFGFTQTELDRAKAAYLSNMTLALKEKNKTNSENYVREYLAYFLKDIAAPGIDKEYELTKADLQKITLTDLTELTRTYITSTNRDIILLAPEKDKQTLPDEKTISGWLTAVENENLTPYTDNANSKPLLAAAPGIGQVKSEHYDKNLNITTLTLSNGVTVLLKPTSFKNDEILFTGFASGGTSLFNDQEYPSASNAAAIVASGGVGNYGADELQKYLQGKQVSVGPFINENYEGINGGSTPDDLETAMKLIYGYFTQPRKDSLIFKSIVARSKAAIANRSNDPASVFSDTTAAVLSNYNPRHMGPTMEKIDRISLEKAFEVYKSSFANAPDFTFIFTGSIDIAKIRPLIEQYLGTLPATGTHREFKDLDIHIPPGKIDKTVYKGSEPKSTVLLFFSGNYDYSQENNIKMDALKEVLEIRLLQRLREDESGVYSPGVFDNINKIPQQRYSLIIQFSCAPQNVDKLVASTLDEINKLKTAGPPQENVDKWRAESKTSFEPQLKTNGFWLNYLNRQLQNHENLDQVNHYNELLQNVTSEQLKAEALKYLSGDNFIKLVLKPESR